MAVPSVFQPDREGGGSVRGEEGHCGKYWGEEQTERRAEGSQLASGLLRPPPRAGHPPLGAQAAAEEEEGHPQDLQCPPAGGLERLPAEGGEPASELPSPRGRARARSRGRSALWRAGAAGRPARPPCPLRRPRVLTRTSAAPGASAPARPTGPVPAAGPGSRHPTHPENTGGRSQTPHPLSEPRPLPPGATPNLGRVVICLQVHFGHKLGDVQSSCKQGPRLRAPLWPRGELCDGHSSPLAHTHPSPTPRAPPLQP